MRKLSLVMAVSIVMFIAFDALSYPSELKTYSDSQYNFSFEYPGEWSVSSRDEVIEATGGTFTPGENTVIFVANPQDLDQNVNVTIGPGAGRSLDDDELEELMRRIFEDFSSTFANFREISGRTITVGSIRGIEVTYEFERLGVALQQKGVMLVEEDRSYLITCTSRKPDFVNADQIVFTKIIGSFQTW